MEVIETHTTISFDWPALHMVLSEIISCHYFLLKGQVKFLSYVIIIQGEVSFKALNNTYI